MTPAVDNCRSSRHFLSQLACRVLPEQQLQDSLSGIIEESASNWAAMMAPSRLLKTASVFLSLQAVSQGQDVASSATVGAVAGSTATSFRPTFTIPADADKGADLLPNINDPDAVDAQEVCPGYKASQLEEGERGLTAVLTLAGAPCNVYGNDVEVLNLKVEYQADDRLAVNIQPAYIVSTHDFRKRIVWIDCSGRIPRILRGLLHRRISRLVPSRSRQQTILI